MKVIFFIVGLMVGTILGHMGARRPVVSNQLPSNASSYQNRVVDYNGKTYYTNAWAFSEGGKCVVFEDQDKLRQMICGNFTLFPNNRQEKTL